MREHTHTRTQEDAHKEHTARGTKEHQPKELTLYPCCFSNKCAAMERFMLLEHTTATLKSRIVSLSQQTHTHAYTCIYTNTHACVYKTKRRVYVCDMHKHIHTNTHAYVSIKQKVVSTATSAACMCVHMHACTCVCDREREREREERGADKRP